VKARLRGHRRLWWSVWVLFFAGTAILALPIAARGDSSLGGWSVTANGNGIDIVIDNAVGLAGAHPFTEADLPAAESDFASGPFGSTLASIFWPGSAGGNLGSLSGELPIPSQLQPLLAQTNDPVRATAQYPAGPVNSQYPTGGSNGAVEMKAHADTNGTSATAALADEQIAGLVGFGSVKGTSSSTASSKAIGTASSQLSGVSLLGGLIQIGGISSTATATSDGNTSSGQAATHVGEVTVLGQPASIGNDGLVLPTALVNSLGPVVGPLLHQTITALGITVTIVPSSETHNGASESITSGGVRLDVVPNPALVAALVGQLELLLAMIPGIPASLNTVTTLPGLLQGSSLSITLGRATASANASPPFSSVFTPPPPSTPVASVATAVPSSNSTTATGIVPASGSVTPAGGSPVASPSLAPVTGPVATTSPSGGAPPRLLGTPIDLSSPIRAAEVILALLAAAAAGYGLWRLARLLVEEDRGPECPLGQENI
jgi:hypothetical protein